MCEQWRVARRSISQVLAYQLAVKYTKWSCSVSLSTLHGHIEKDKGRVPSEHKVGSNSKERRRNRPNVITVSVHLLWWKRQPDEWIHSAHCRRTACRRNRLRFQHRRQFSTQIGIEKGLQIRGRVKIAVVFATLLFFTVFFNVELWPRFAVVCIQQTQQPRQMNE